MGQITFFVFCFTASPILGCNKNSNGRPQYSPNQYSGGMEDIPVLMERVLTQMHDFSYELLAKQQEIIEQMQPKVVKHTGSITGEEITQEGNVYHITCNGYSCNSTVYTNSNISAHGDGDESPVDESGRAITSEASSSTAATLSASLGAIFVAVLFVVQRRIRIRKTTTEAETDINCEAPTSRTTHTIITA